MSIVDATASAAKARNVSSVGLLGLRFVVEASLYQVRLAREGIRTVRPSTTEQQYIDAAYLDELVNGIFRDDTRDELSRIIAGMHDREDIDAVILGGTELSLLLTGPSTAGVPLLHSAQMHVERALDWLLGTEAFRSDFIGHPRHVTFSDAD